MTKKKKSVNDKDSITPGGKYPFRRNKYNHTE